MGARSPLPYQRPGGRDGRDGRAERAELPAIEIEVERPDRTGGGESEVVAGARRVGARSWAVIGFAATVLAGLGITAVTGGRTGAGSGTADRRTTSSRSAPPTTSSGATMPASAPVSVVTGLSVSPTSPGAPAGGTAGATGAAGPTGATGATATTMSPNGLAVGAYPNRVASADGNWFADFVHDHVGSGPLLGQPSGLSASAASGDGEVHFIDFDSGDVIHVRITGTNDSALVPTLYAPDAVVVSASGPRPAAAIIHRDGRIATDPRFGTPIGGQVRPMPTTVWLHDPTTSGLVHLVDLTTGSVLRSEQAPAGATIDTAIDGAVLLRGPDGRTYALTGAAGGPEPLDGAEIRSLRARGAGDREVVTRCADDLTTCHFVYRDERGEREILGPLEATSYLAVASPAGPHLVALVRRPSCPADACYGSPVATIEVFDVDRSARFDLGPAAEYAIDQSFVRLRWADDGSWLFFHSRSLHLKAWKPGLEAPITIEALSIDDLDAYPRS